MRRIVKPMDGVPTPSAPPRAIQKRNTGRCLPLASTLRSRKRLAHQGCSRVQPLGLLPPGGCHHRILPPRSQSPGGGREMINPCSARLEGHRATSLRSVSLLPDSSKDAARLAIAGSCTPLRTHFKRGLGCTTSHLTCSTAAAVAGWRVRVPANRCSPSRSVPQVPLRHH